jgi:hypothetical protein
VFPLFSKGTKLGELCVHKHTQDRALARDLPEALHQLSQALCVHLDRLQHSNALAGAPGGA